MFPLKNSSKWLATTLSNSLLSTSMYFRVCTTRLLNRSQTPIFSTNSNAFWKKKINFHFRSIESRVFNEMFEKGDLSVSPVLSGKTSILAPTDHSTKSTGSVSNSNFFQLNCFDCWSISDFCDTVLSVFFQLHNKPLLAVELTLLFVQLGKALRFSATEHLWKMDSKNRKTGYS